MCRPMRMLPRVARDDETGNMNLGTFKVFGQSIFVQYLFIRNSVIANQGVREYQYLTAITRIRQCFRISNHSSIEYYFSAHRSVGTKGVSGNDRTECIGIIFNVCASTSSQIQNGRIALRKNNHLSKNELVCALLVYAMIPCARFSLLLHVPESRDIENHH